MFAGPQNPPCNLQVQPDNTLAEMRHYSIYCVVLSVGLASLEIPESFAFQNPSLHQLVRAFQRSAATKSGFDEAAYEKDRLEKDAEAMTVMKEVAENEFAKLRTPWKWDIRKRIWDMMEEKDIAQYPRPVHHRIPNFKGAEQAAARLAALPEFVEANIIKVNPDTPQRAVRHAVLQQRKTLLTPQPRLRTGFFSTIRMDLLPSLVEINDCTNSAGVAKWGTAVTLNDKYNVDLVVVGSTAVCPRTGARVGKGEGFAELEWGILSAQGNLDPLTTLVVTTVHDEQVVDDIPVGSLTKHDVPVDVIVTPTKVIRVPNRAPKPSGIFWDLLSPQKLGQIRVLQQLKLEVEAREGITLPSGPDEVLPPVAKKSEKSGKAAGNKKKSGTGSHQRSSRNKPDLGSPAPGTRD